LLIRIQESLELRAKRRVVSAKLVQISGAIVRREVYDLIKQLLQVIPRRHLLLAEFGEQPGSSNSPISLYRSYGDFQNLGDLFFGAPAKKAQLHYATLAGGQIRQTAERLIDRQ
jgi:hypothetical protein